MRYLKLAGLAIVAAGFLVTGVAEAKGHKGHGPKAPRIVKLR